MADPDPNTNTNTIAQHAQHASIHALFASYESILNTSFLAAAISLYTPTGIFLAPNSPPAIGTAAISRAYAQLFAFVEHDVTVHVEEIFVMDSAVPLAGGAEGEGEEVGREGAQWAFARTSTTGRCKVRATGAVLRDAVWQLWVLSREEEGGWRVARYGFAPTGEGAKVSGEVGLGVSVTVEKGEEREVMR